MNRGIIYYNRGEKCLIRLAVSLYTLRRHYDGAVTVIYEGIAPVWLLELLTTLSVDIVYIPPEASVDYALLQKTRLWRWSPYDTTLYIDLDTVIMQDPSELFDIIEDKGFAVTKFADWKSDGHLVGCRTSAWLPLVGQRIIDEALSYGPATNTAVFGFVRGHPLLAAWDTLATQGWDDIVNNPKSEILNRTLDESACQVLGPQFDIGLIDERWNRSVQFGIAPVEKIGIIHYHSGKHCRPNNPLCEYWRAAYWEMWHQDKIPGDPHGDAKLVKFELSRARQDLTICCAADPKYMKKFMRHFKLWIQTPGLREQHYILLCINADTNDKAYDEIRQYPGVRLIPYHSEAESRREAAFEAFVFGTAMYVDSPYWMKLDGDATPRGEFIWPEYNKYTVVADRWHYSKVKGENDWESKGHWLNRLDDWWAKQDVPDRSPMFEKISERRHKHRRLRSYCWIEKTEFTRQVAAMYGGRLPVPSHDTSQWYLATRLGVPMKSHRVRKYINA